MRRSIRLSPLVLAAALFAGTAGAQSRYRVTGQPERPSAATRRPQETRLKANVGIPVAKRLLESDDPFTRIRGVERLGAIGSDEAINALVDAIDQGTPASRDPRARLTAVRVLAEHTKRDNVRQLLMREVTDTGGSETRGGFSPLAAIIRSTAALALARGGDKKSMAALVTALLQPGPASDAATRALRVYPPASLESFLEGRKRLSPQLATFLGELGDLRAIDRLRAILGEPDTAGKIAASVALAKLGDESAIPLAREWLKKSEPRLRKAAAEVFAYLGAPEAGPSIAALLESDATREDGLRLALASPWAGFSRQLVKAIPDLSEAGRVKAMVALARSRGLPELLVLMEKPEHATSAAFALATMPGDGARMAIEAALGEDAGKKGDRRRLLIRAGVVRALMLDDAPAGLRAGLRDLYKSDSAIDRGVAAFGLVATGAEGLDDLVDQKCKDVAAGAAFSCDTAVLAGAARGALALRGGADSLDPLLPLLARAARQADPITRSGAAGSPDQSDAFAAAAAAALLAHPDGGDLPTSVLAMWAEAGGPLAPLAARALPSRDDEALRGRIKRLLEGSDPVVRAHTALGLGRDPEPSAASMLARAYRFEDDASVRRAIIRALSRRTEVQRASTLTLARYLDPDDEVRSLARSALDGRTLDPGAKQLGVEPRRSVAWIAIVSNEGRAATRDQGARSARLVRADGLAVPVVSDPDGVLLVPGLPQGAASLLLGPVSSDAK